MKSWIRKIPVFLLILLLAVIYLACGYIVGYFHGYQAGQDDYFMFLENLKVQ